MCRKWRYAIILKISTNVQSNPKFSKLKELLDLCEKLVETNKCNTFGMVYKLLK